ncbi:TetR/AcrR family transcriptional regulator [Bifidobacterium avesanii]|uniref:TetR family transcriptional regulator n=1 Tax=Bifidobacterium avesanii TaxID=1798157 RepID=A0A7K3TF27_9BIFI|nr:TetR/AcrR family transcriptional regulator [Bifidobacterium avesanii]KAB8295674.1 AcrR family transcriptional regulator [Bifidobacterium avesanii]NEG77678.1 TetR family transcriptional regulator [Bifidobacterium avesanii]
MGRPKANDASAPQRMRDTFWKLLADKPYARITVSDVTRESGLNRSAFYYHYASIAELADDAIAAIYDDPTIIAFIVSMIRKPDDKLFDRAEYFIASNQYRDMLSRVSLIAGPHGSTGLVRQFKDFIEDTWLKLLGVDRDALDQGQRITLEFAASGILGAIGAGMALTPETATALRRSRTPELISQMVNSLRTPAAPEAGEK